MSYESSKKYKSNNKDKIKKVTFEFHEKDFDIFERFFLVKGNTKNQKLRNLLNHFDDVVENQINDFELSAQVEKKAKSEKIQIQEFLI